MKLRVDNALPFLGFLIFILSWWLVKSLIFPNAIFLSYPQDAIWRLLDLIDSGNIVRDFKSTFEKFLQGYLIAVFFGVPTGFILGSNAKLYRTFEFVLDFFRSIPVTTLFPLFILYFGIGDITIVAMIVIACIFVIILNTSYGVFYTSSQRLKYIKSLGASPIQCLWHVTLPSSLPFVFAGLRTTVSFALIVVIVAEMFIGTNFGLGKRVYEAHETYLISDVYAITLFVGLLGYLINKVFLFLERKVIHWSK